MLLILLSGAMPQQAVARLTRWRYLYFGSPLLIGSMSERVCDDVAGRIVGHIQTRRLPAGHHLPAQDLANLFGVSRAPVTRALQQLAVDGLVTQIRNRGFYVADDAHATPTTAVLEDPLYVAIVESRLDDRLADRVSENELMRQFAVPRGRLRRTLQRIAEEGWAERSPGYGWIFRPTLRSRTEYEQAYRFRALVEVQALVEPDFRPDRTQLLRLREEQEALLSGGIEQWSRARLFEANSRFHETVVSWSGNGILLDALRRVNRLRRLAEHRVTGDRSRLAAECHDHLHILDLIEAGDLTVAGTYIRTHLEAALGRKVDALT